MGKYFGTDGIRGIANEELDISLAMRTGFALGHRLCAEGQTRPQVLIGRDTRISGTMLQAALSAGLCAAGADVIDIGVLPTPGVSYLCANTADIAAGIVISASHNPYEHNGIKIFGGDGYKLTDAQEAQMEHDIDHPPKASKIGADLGCILPADAAAWRARYIEHLRGSAGLQDTGLRLLIDCANGSASTTAAAIFGALGSAVDFLAKDPDGVNINEGCGSTHIAPLQEAVVRGGYDLGIAFDGDADRCMLVDEQGAEIDGDAMIGVLAVYMHKQGLLKGGVVGTIVSNLGLQLYLAEQGIDMVTTKVGDRYVLERMRAEGHNLGGEQSGHVILSDYATTGDGQLSALHFLHTMVQTGQSASQLRASVPRYPQVTINVSVPNAHKAKVAEMEEVQTIQAEIATRFGKNGRIVIRPSGTEAKVRVMVEGKDEALVREMAARAAQSITDGLARIQ